MGEKEVCKFCKFYMREENPRCQAPVHIKDNCTYWNNEKQKIIAEAEEELKAVDRE